MTRFLRLLRLLLTHSVRNKSAWRHLCRYRKDFVFLRMNVVTTDQIHGNPNYLRYSWRKTYYHPSFPYMTELLLPNTRGCRFAHVLIFASSSHCVTGTEWVSSVNFCHESFKHRFLRILLGWQTKHISQDLGPAIINAFGICYMLNGCGCCTTIKVWITLTEMYTTVQYSSSI